MRLLVWTFRWPPSPPGSCRMVKRLATLRAPGARGRRPSHRAARRAAGLLWATALLVAGCLPPGEITERSVRNAAVQVDRELVQPGTEGVMVIEREAHVDEPFRFVVPAGAVRDPDGDAPQFAWYLDYDPQAPSQPVAFTSTFDLLPCGDDPELRVNRTFPLTLIVSDRQLVFNIPPDEQDFRTFPEGTTTVFLTWQVRLEGRCP